MIKLIAAILVIAGAYLGYCAIDASITGVLVPKNPDFPVLRDETPSLFWGLALSIAVAGLFTLRAGWLMWSDEGRSAEDSEQ